MASDGHQSLMSMFVSVRSVVTILRSLFRPNQFCHLEVCSISPRMIAKEPPKQRSIDLAMNRRYIPDGISSL